MTVLGYTISPAFGALIMRQGETFGPSQSSHMQALLLRVLREGVTVIREEF